MRARRAVVLFIRYDVRKVDIRHFGEKLVIFFFRYLFIGRKLIDVVGSRKK